MDLDKLSVAVRPRSGWEAVDLGFAMARCWFVPLWTLWLALAVPVWLIAHLALLRYPWLAVLLTWWLKPLYEIVVLHWLSRALFGERPRVADVLRQLRRIAGPQLVHNLLWRRFALSRAFNMPVALLEGQRGAERAERLRDLHRGQSVPAWFTIIAVHLEAVLYLGLFAGAVLAVPEQLRWVDPRTALVAPDLVTQLLQNACYLAAMSLLAPFYVAGGFALYLTRRAGLEAWDLELGLRRMLARARQAPARQRPSRAAALVTLALTATLLAGAPPTRAETLTPHSAHARIEQVLADPLFGRIETRQHWEYIDGETPARIPWQLLSTELLRAIAGAAEVTLWLALAVLVIWLAARLRRDARWWTPRRAPAVTGQTPPEILFGLPVSADSLPHDPAAAAREALEGGDARAALGLLYRAALAGLVHHHQVAIPASATEGEALRRVAGARPRAQASYFARLTEHWLALAYGGRQPDDARVRRLCDEWPRHFAT